MSSERGSVSIIVAAMMAAIVVLALGAADVARVFAVASRAQSAADAAALAAAQELALPAGEGSPGDIAAAYAIRNGAALRTCACEPGTFDAQVEVDVAVGPLSLAPDDLRVTASARAVVDLPTP
ncbi:MAG TPA: Rv3654c family TadE-like protein [Actinomycetota bacterium]|nr:Rv3654c family TadE-like protein [Actinomycetota bacterium]